MEVAVQELHRIRPHQSLPLRRCGMYMRGEREGERRGGGEGKGEREGERERERERYTITHKHRLNPEPRRSCIQAATGTTPRTLTLITIGWPSFLLETISLNR